MNDILQITCVGWVQPYQIYTVESSSFKKKICYATAAMTDWLLTFVPSLKIVKYIA